MRAEIVSVGTEILIGSILNTNAQFLSERLAERGVDVYHQVTVGDNIPRLAKAIQTALSRTDLVICSGGLGPTEDDITMEGAARALGVKRLFHAETARHIRERLRSAGLPSSKLSTNQCRIPEGAILFQNENGTAPGVLCQTLRAGDIKYVLLLPGPPKELNPLFLKQAWPKLAALWGAQTDALAIRTLKITGLVETQVAEKITSLLKQKPPLTCGIYAKAGEVQLKVMSKAKTEHSAQAAIVPVEKMLRRTFGDSIFGVDDDSMASVAVSFLNKKNQTLSLAESCTGGLTAHLLTETPGSSAVFLGGIVAYANNVKEKFLGVSTETLRRHGAVSSQTALQMARGIRQALGSSIGIGITGIAGPSGGTSKKPAGLVFIALSDKRTSIVRRYCFAGQRSRVKLKAALNALNLLRLHLSKNAGRSKE